MRILFGIIVISVSLTWSLASADPGAEPGFTPFFNGKDLTGWRTKKDNVSLEGRVDAYNKRFFVENEELVIDPKVNGDVIIETIRPFSGDVIIRFEFKPANGCNNDLFIRGVKFDLTAKNVPNMKHDVWNAFQIVVRNGQIEFSNNEELLKTVTAKPTATPLGIRAEQGGVRFRHFRYRDGK
jgi:hypothetical protein